MPRSVLLGRRRRAVTTYQYDQTGRLVRSVTVWDPEWTPQDVAWAQAYAEEQAARCPGCGQPLDESTDPANEGAYEAPFPVRCFACSTLEHRQKDYRDKPEGLLFTVVRKR